MTDYPLIPRLLEHSHADDWADAVLEWDLIHVFTLDHAYAECLCGHFPLTNVYILSQGRSGDFKEVVVGSECVKHVTGTNPERLARGIRRVKKDMSKSLPTKVVDFAHRDNVINQKDYNFYQDVRAKRKLSTAQESWKRDINRKIIRWHNYIVKTVLNTEGDDAE